jgi:hypothetical protein
MTLLNAHKGMGGRKAADQSLQNHALQEVKNEESQLKHLAVATPERAKTDLRWHLDLTGDSFD